MTRHGSWGAGDSRGMTPVPDHDGRPISPEAARELAARLADVDRRYGASPFRRAFRAALCRHYGDSMGEHREMTLLLAEAGDHHGLSRDGVNRLTMPLPMYLARKGRGPHRSN